MVIVHDKFLFSSIACIPDRRSTSFDLKLHLVQYMYIENGTVVQLSNTIYRNDSKIYMPDHLYIVPGIVPCVPVIWNPLLIQFHHPCVSLCETQIFTSDLFRVGFFFFFTNLYLLTSLDLPPNLTKRFSQTDIFS